MKSSILVVLALGFAGFGALEVAALNPTNDRGKDTAEPAADVTPNAHSDDASSSHDDDGVTREASLGTTDRNGLGQSLNTASYSQDAACLTPALVAAFEPRREALDARAATLDTREAELQNLETRLQSRLSEMEEMRGNLQDMTARLDTVAGEDITHLVQMYSTMKPKKAAAIFDRMDPAFAAGFLREIDSARAGIIMADMSEEQSYRISLLIANRHAEWRKP